jgi:5'-3' exonuclease
VRLNVLRDYLGIELRPLSALPFGSSLEHVIDDFILLCSLCGNDFLPSIPSLLIREGTEHIHFLLVTRTPRHID